MIICMEREVRAQACDCVEAGEWPGGQLESLPACCLGVMRTPVSGVLGLDTELDQFEDETGGEESEILI